MGRDYSQAAQEESGNLIGMSNTFTESVVEAAFAWPDSADAQVVRARRIAPYTATDRLIKETTA